MLQYLVVRHVCKHSFPEFHEVACNKLTNIGGKACNNIPQAVNKLAFSARLDHSCETVLNNHDASYYSKQNSKFYYRVKYQLYYLQLYD